MARDALRRQRFGAHMSIAGGLDNAFTAAVAAECDCLQIFVKNQKQWTAPPLTDDARARYRAAAEQTGIHPVVAHASYLINLGSPDPAQWQRSIDATVDELARCAALGVIGLVVHPGAHMGAGEQAGLDRIATALDRIHRQTPGVATRILLESTAGQGTALGYRIEHLGALVRQVSQPDRIGICLDTCHLFAAGYDLRDAAAYEAMVAALDREVGCPRIACIHMNDSKGACGSRIDRHEHIGKGKIGRRGFVRVVNDRRLAAAIKVLETPKGTDGRGADLDRTNLRKLRRWIGAREVS